MSHKNGTGLLHQAVAEGDLAKTESALKRGAHINCVNDENLTALLIAAKKGYQKHVALLLRHKASTDFTDTDGYNCLHYALGNGHLEVAMYLMENGGLDINTPTKDGTTLLHLASQRGYNEAVDWLLMLVVDLDMVKCDSTSPLMAAASKDHLYIVEALMEAGIEINTQNRLGYTALSIAVEKQNLQSVKLLLTKGFDADLNLSLFDGTTPLIIAACTHNVSIIQELLRKGVYINTQNNQGKTALYLVCKSGHKNTAKYLLDQQANPEIGTKKNKTALMTASHHGKSLIVDLLMHSNVNVNTQSITGDSALHYATKKPYIETINILLNNGANASLQNSNGVTPLFMAVQSGFVKIVQLFLSHRADTNIQCKKSGKTALYIACKKGFMAIATMLINNGADVNMTKHNGRSPLITVSSHGHIGIVDILLQCGADIDQQTDNGETAFFTACKNGHMDTAHLLLENGADIDKPRNDEIRPLSVALSYEHQQIIPLLLQYKVCMDYSTCNGDTPLIQAVKNGDELIVQLFLQSGASVNLASTSRDTPLHHATLKNHQRIVKQILQLKPMITKNTQNKTALGIASNCGYKAIEEIIVEYERHQINGTSPSEILNHNGIEDTEISHDIILPSRIVYYMKTVTPAIITHMHPGPVIESLLNQFLLTGLDKLCLQPLVPSKQAEYIVDKMVLPGTLYTVKGFTRALKESQYHVNLYIAELMGKAQEQNTVGATKEFLNTEEKDHLIEKFYEPFVDNLKTEDLIKELFRLCAIDKHHYNSLLSMHEDSEKKALFLFDDVLLRGTYQTVEYFSQALINTKQKELALLLPERKCL